MSASAKSMFAFGLYLGAAGLSLVLIPNTLLGWFNVPEVHDVWIRVFGMLAFLLGLYYLRAAQENVRAFFRWTVFVRPLVIVFLTGFVLAGLAPPSLILIGAIDLSGAIWTGLAMRAEDRLSAGS